MKLIKRLSAIGVAVAMAATFATSVFAANRTAYSVGVNYYESASDTTADDFVTNAKNAANSYAKVSDISSVRTHNPTTTSLKNHLNDNVIFLNSHANYDHIAFRYINSNGVYTQVGVRMGSDGTGSSGAKYVGLSGRDMSNVELITFAGCKTAYVVNGSNVAYAAVASGAKCSVGFSGEIVSRNTTGQNWLKSYNNYLASGCNVGEAVTKATKDNSTSNLGKYVHIYGYGAHKITTSATKAATFSDGNDIVTAEQILSSESALLDFMKSYNSEFNSDEYKYYVNIFNEESNTGMIVFNHYINDTIITNKAYVVCIENGFVTDILKSNIGNQTDEETLSAQVAAFSSRPEIVSYSETENNAYKTEEIYEYDYNTNELKYTKVEYTIGETGEIIENVTETLV